MRILKITEYAIEFDNGKGITFEHDQECCHRTTLHGEEMNVGYFA